MNKFIPVALSAAFVFALTGCDVDVEDEGKLPSVSVDGDAGNMPEYEVTKVKEGNLPSVDVDAEAGRMPEVEVRGPDIEVKEKPVVIPVPDVDIDPAKEHEG